MTENLAQTIKLQQLASNPKNSSWVFASAGSGKTKVLTDRVLRLLLSNVTPDKILCLTFTKVAAAEMQNRINNELAKWVLLNDQQLREKLFELSGHNASSEELKKSRILFAEILDAEAKIKIQTIHSFCQSLIKIFPFEAKVRPNFEVLEDAQEKLFLQKSRKEVLKKSAQNPQLRQLISTINSKLHEATFAELIEELLSKKEQLTILKENYFGIDGVIDAIFKKFRVDKNQNEEDIFADFVKLIDQKKVLELAAALQESGLKNNSESAAKIIKFFANPIAKNFSSYRLAFFTKEDEIRKINGKILDNPYFAAIANDQIALIQKFIDNFNSHKICNSTALLLKFVDQILENYSQIKAQNSFLDYNDLIIETNKLLANPNFSDWVKMKIDGLFDHILVDESQDTNHQQWNIIKALTEDFFSGMSVTNKNRTIFIVGDEKQSIYSFQGAQADISAEIFAYFAEKLRDNPIKFHKIDLSNSFRSLPTILEVVDVTFGQEKEKNAITKISDFQGHKAIRQGVGYFEIWPQIKLKKEEKPKTKEKDYEWKFDLTVRENYFAEEFLAQNIALKIKDWVESGRVLEGHNKPVKYGDFMILLRRRTNGFDRTLQRFFYQYQIPFGGSNKTKFSDSLIIQDLLSAARFALSSHDDLNLAALLKSPIFAISEEELLEICLLKNQNKITVYQALQQLEKFSKTAEILRDLQKKAQQLNCFEFFNFILTQENRRKIANRFGSQALEILNKFSLKTFDFCDNLSPNLQKFLDFVEKLNPEISFSDNNHDQVLITTVHSAKGLQAPIVILPDCSFNTNQLRSTKEKISWIDDLPIWCAAKEEENNLLRSAREIKKREAKDEYLRLLYVAMTRAENELYVAGSGNTNDDECWYNLIKKSVANKCRKTEFLNEKNRQLVSDNFEIADEILHTGEQPNNFVAVKKSEILEIDGQEFFENQKKFSQFKSTNQNSEIAENQINRAQIKGKLIHKILETFGKNHRSSKKWLGEIAQKIISREEFLSEREKDAISDEVLKFLNCEHFEKLFCGEVNCEVELASDTEIKRIDLLVEKEDEVLIVDYKSEETLPTQAPQHYITQLKTYKNLVQKIYPHKKIVTAIFWVKFLQLEIR